MNIDAINSAVQVVGSQTALAKVLGCTPQNVQRMCATGKVPAKHVLKIEAATGISRSLLSPEIYPESSPTLNETLRPNPTAHQSAVGAGVLSSSAEVA
ncbi:helix-turn-helix domain-containing protein [Pseudomonas sp. WS 5412]|uniref:transcriptional regulator n=1 Tax=Pseudomonas sp. WS 5412 TaxID=2717487 RepID=UPI0014739BFD|nr:YdaS family helix-turn-helix protein [Pseudomonas sp. WS 5412]NMY31945.1 helix-turn-helix domain-containing protein [Pseudomonas sp. WS 5412]